MCLRSSCALILLLQLSKPDPHTQSLLTILLKSICLLVIFNLLFIVLIFLTMIVALSFSPKTSPYTTFEFLISWANKKIDTRQINRRKISKF